MSRTIVSCTPSGPQKEVTCEYFLTLTLKPFLYKESVKRQLEITEDQIKDFLKHMDASGVMVFETTKSANVHYHALLTFNVPEFISKRLIYYVQDYFRKSKVIGFVDCQQVIDYKKVLFYLFYDYEETELNTEIKPVQFNKSDYKVDIWSPEFDFDKCKYISKELKEQILEEIKELKKEENHTKENYFNFKRR